MSKISRLILEWKNKHLGANKWEADPPGKEGVWRRTMNKNVFYPDDGSAPIYLPKKGMEKAGLEFKKGKGFVKKSKEGPSPWLSDRSFMGSNPYGGFHISPLQRHKMSKSQRKSVDKQALDWAEKQSQSQGGWADSIIAAWDEGKFDPKDKGVSKDAKEVIHLEKQRRARQMFQDKKKEIKKTHEEAIKPGSIISMHGEYAEVLKVLKKRYKVMTADGKTKDFYRGLSATISPQDVEAQAYQAAAKEHGWFMPEGWSLDQVKAAQNHKVEIPEPGSITAALKKAPPRKTTVGKKFDSSEEALDHYYQNSSTVEADHSKHLKWKKDKEAGGVASKGMLIQKQGKSFILNIPGTDIDMGSSSTLKDAKARAALYDLLFDGKAAEVLGQGASSLTPEQKKDSYEAHVSFSRGYERLIKRALKEHVGRVSLIGKKGAGITILD